MGNSFSNGNNVFLATGEPLILHLSSGFRYNVNRVYRQTFLSLWRPGHGLRRPQLHDSVRMREGKSQRISIIP